MEVELGVPVGEGVRVRVLDGVSVAVAVGVLVPQAICVNTNCSPLCKPARLHENCVNLVPVSLCTPTVELPPPWSTWP